MPLFYFHLRDGVDIVLDPDGSECADLATVRAKTLHTARDVMAGDVMKGILDLTHRIDVEDADRVIVHSLVFEDAVTITSRGHVGRGGAEA